MRIVDSVIGRMRALKATDMPGIEFLDLRKERKAAPSAIEEPSASTMRTPPPIVVAWLEPLPYAHSPLTQAAPSPSVATPIGAANPPATVSVRPKISCATSRSRRAARSPVVLAIITHQRGSAIRSGDLRDRIETRLQRRAGSAIVLGHSQLERPGIGERGDGTGRDTAGCFRRSCVVSDRVEHVHVGGGSALRYRARAGG